MSCAFRALPRIIAELILSAPRSSEVVIISPWIQQVTLQPPVMGTQGRWYTQRQMYLSRFIEYVIERRNLRLSIVVRELDKEVRKVIRNALRLYPDAVHVYEEKFLHAKAIATNSTILRMSANIIPTSLYRNVETCSLSTNPYGTSRKFAQLELKLKL